MQMWKIEIAYDPNSGEKALLFCHLPVFSSMQVHLKIKLGSFCAQSLVYYASLKKWLHCWICLKFPNYHPW